MIKAKFCTLNFCLLLLASQAWSSDSMIGATFEVDPVHLANASDSDLVLDEEAGASLHVNADHTVITHTNTLLQQARMARILKTDMVRQVRLSARVIRVDKSADPEAATTTAANLQVLTRPGERARASQGMQPVSKQAAARTGGTHISFEATPSLGYDGSIRLEMLWASRSELSGKAYELSITNTFLLADSSPTAIHTRNLSGSLTESIYVECELLDRLGQPLSDAPLAGVTLHGAMAQSNTIWRIPLETACLGGVATADPGPNGQIDLDDLEEELNMKGDRQLLWDPLLQELIVTGNPESPANELRMLATRCPPSSQLKLELQIFRVPQGALALDAEGGRRLVQSISGYTIPGVPLLVRSQSIGREAAVMSVSFKSVPVPGTRASMLDLVVQGTVAQSGFVSQLDIESHASLFDGQPVVVHERPAGADREVYIVVGTRVDAFGRSMYKPPYGFSIKR